MARREMTHEQLLKENRILKRQVGQLKKDVKVNPRKLRQEALKEGYNNAVAQLQPQIDKVNDLEEEIRRLQETLQAHAILY